MPRIKYKPQNIEIMKILRTNSADYKVVVNQDGTLNITNLTKNNAAIPNAGAFIVSMGGIEGVLNRCKDMTEQQYAEGLAKRKLQKEESIKKAAERRIETERLLKAEYDTAFSGNVTETNIENITILLRYLNSMNWGAWRFPKMTIGYTCNQYDCDGRWATTIKLDRPIEIDGVMVDRFQTGVPVGHLTKYHRIR